MIEREPLVTIPDGTEGLISFDLLDDSVGFLTDRCVGLLVIRIDADIDDDIAFLLAVVRGLLL